MCREFLNGVCEKYGTDCPGRLGFDAQRVLGYCVFNTMNSQIDPTTLPELPHYQFYLVGKRTFEETTRGDFVTIETDSPGALISRNGVLKQRG